MVLRQQLAVKKQRIFLHPNNAKLFFRYDIDMIKDANFEAICIFIKKKNFFRKYFHFLTVIS